MRLDLLERLIAILEAVPAEHFGLASWYCGTAACAIGWAARDATFNALGLVPFDGAPAFVVGVETLISWSAVEAFFELNIDQAFHLFNDEAYGGREVDDDYRPSDATARDVIARLQAFINDQRENA